MVRIRQPMQEMQETWVRSLGQEDPLENEMATHSRYSCLENPNGQRNLVGYNPRGYEWVRRDLATKQQFFFF